MRILSLRIVSKSVLRSRYLKQYLFTDLSVLLSDLISISSNSPLILIQRFLIHKTVSHGGLVVHTEESNPSHTFVVLRANHRFWLQSVFSPQIQFCARLPSPPSGFEHSTPDVEFLHTQIGTRVNSESIVVLALSLVILGAFNTRCGHCSSRTAALGEQVNPPVPVAQESENYY